MTDSLDHSNEILRVEELHTVFQTRQGTAAAVSDVSFSMAGGKTLGIVGESGSGKSVTALSVMRLITRPGRIDSGRILFGGNDLLTLSEKQMQDIRGNRIAMIFQEPMTSLNPLIPVGRQIAEMFMRHTRLSKKECHNRAVEMLETVQIPSPGKRARDYPHQLSGGMRQRVMIAMALACKPELLIADEPTTALDVTIQAQVLDLMMRLKEQSNTGVMMITHDLGVVAEIAEDVIVMYAGQIVETGDVRTIFNDPKHPYTLALLQSTLKPGTKKSEKRQRLPEIKGVVPGLFDLPEGCRFHDRCPRAEAACRQNPQVLERTAENGMVRCRRYRQ